MSNTFLGTTNEVTPGNVLTLFSRRDTSKSPGSFACQLSVRCSQRRKLSSGRRLLTGQYGQRLHAHVLRLVVLALLLIHLLLVFLLLFLFLLLALLLLIFSSSGAPCFSVVL